MQKFDPKELKKLYMPPLDSHKGQNGRLMIIGGSHLFHAASIWALEVASRIVDLVHYASTPENNAIVMEVKKQFRDGIVIPRKDIEHYIEEDDCILIGPGMMRSEASQATGDRRQKTSLSDIEEMQDEGRQTAALTNYLLAKYPRKQWVIDAGALQMVDPGVIPRNAILTPHHREFTNLLRGVAKVGKTAHLGRRALILAPSRSRSFFSPCISASQGSDGASKRHASPCAILRSSRAVALSLDEAEPDSPAWLPALADRVNKLAKRLHSVILLKGQVDLVCSPTDCRIVDGGNAGMTKGGTGDVLAGLVAALACHNDPFLAACVGSYINKKAGDALYARVGPYFNATDLARQIPQTMSRLLL